MTTEAGVHYRGKAKGFSFRLPESWKDTVDPDKVFVQLTPRREQNLWVMSIIDWEVFIGCQGFMSNLFNPPEYYYSVYAELKHEENE